MSQLLKEPEIITSLIALFGVLTSVLLSQLSIRRQMRLDFEKFEKTIKSKYEEKVIDKRFVAYESIWKMLTKLNKSTLDLQVQKGEIKNHLSNVLSELETWYEMNGIFLSNNGYGRFTRICAILSSYAKKSSINNPAKLADLRRRVWDLRQVLREDLHLESIKSKKEANMA